jgi:hypothetical protein
MLLAVSKEVQLVVVSVCSLSFCSASKCRLLMHLRLVADFLLDLDLRWSGLRTGMVGATSLLADVGVFREEVGEGLPTPPGLARLALRRANADRDSEGELASSGSTGGGGGTLPWLQLSMTLSF